MIIIFQKEILSSNNFRKSTPNIILKNAWKISFFKFYFNK